jgi:hypothetical protein
VLVIQGYSTSFHWPHFLRRKLDRYLGSDPSVEIRWATRGRTPIAKWMDPETGRRLDTWREVISPALGDRMKAPSIVLAQESLQGVFGAPNEGIRGVGDIQRIRKGKEVLGRFAKNLLGDGADQVVIATHIYKHPLEPAIGNERLSLAALLEEGMNGVVGGPDVWTPTRDHFPRAFDTDGLHPGYIGAEIMAHHWFVSLLELNNRPIPSWSEEELAGVIAADPMSTLMMRYKGLVPDQNLLRSERWKKVLERFDADGDGELNEAEETRWNEEEIATILSGGR